MLDVATDYVSIEKTAARLALTPVALRARCRRAAQREGRNALAHLGAGVIGYKFGRSWRVRFPPVEAEGASALPEEHAHPLRGPLATAGATPHYALDSIKATDVSTFRLRAATLPSHVLQKRLREGAFTRTTRGRRAAR